MARSDGGGERIWSAGAVMTDDDRALFCFIFVSYCRFAGEIESSRVCQQPPFLWDSAQFQSHL